MDGSLGRDVGNGRQVDAPFHLQPAKQDVPVGGVGDVAETAVGQANRADGRVNDRRVQSDFAVGVGDPKNQLGATTWNNELEQ